MDQLERVGIVGKADGSKPRSVLVTDEVQLDRILENLNVQ
jgi:DNA segregation ATPase FtsK/SpoIIIE-like protein